MIFVLTNVLACVNFFSVSWRPKMQTKKDPTVEKIRQYMRKEGLTQEDFAREINCSAATVNRWLRGKFIPGRSYRYILKLKKII